ncbi:uncharacterized protein TNCV_2638461 [Trichonephila clavipes]|nr:uncharacterized protein TNCV_2638461 [Trichonephila clavipes]
MDVCKCIVPSRHGGTLNSRRAASPLVRLVDGEERWEASDDPQGVSPQSWGGAELNHFVKVFSFFPASPPFLRQISQSKPGVLNLLFPTGLHTLDRYFTRPQFADNGKPHLRSKQN